MERHDAFSYVCNQRAQLKLLRERINNLMENNASSYVIPSFVAAVAMKELIAQSSEG